MPAGGVARCVRCDATLYRHHPESLERTLAFTAGAIVLFVLVVLGITARLFGFLALSGRATAFMGPALLSLVTGLAASQRVGMATILPFFAAGLLLLGRPTKAESEN